MIGASEEQLDVFNEVWYSMLLNAGQAAKGKTDIQFVTFWSSFTEVPTWNLWLLNCSDLCNREADQQAGRSPFLVAPSGIDAALDNVLLA